MGKVQIETRNLTRSFNEALILSALRGGPLHGYQLVLEIADRSQGRFRFNHGTLYPILHKLEKAELIQGAWSDEGPRGKRKSYELTEPGRRYLEELTGSWKELIEHFLEAIGEEES